MDKGVEKLLEVWCGDLDYMSLEEFLIVIEDLKIESESVYEQLKQYFFNSLDNHHGEIKRAVLTFIKLTMSDFQKQFDEDLTQEFLTNPTIIEYLKTGEWRAIKEEALMKYNKTGEFNARAEKAVRFHEVKYYLFKSSNDFITNYSESVVEGLRFSFNLSISNYPCIEKSNKKYKETFKVNMPNFYTAINKHEPDDIKSLADITIQNTKYHGLDTIDVIIERDIIMPIWNLKKFPVNAIHQLIDAGYENKELLNGILLMKHQEVREDFKIIGGDTITDLLVKEEKRTIIEFLELIKNNGIKIFNKEAIIIEK